MMKCFVVTTETLPDPLIFPEKADSFARIIGKLKGLVGVHPYFDAQRAATCKVFRTLEDARAAAINVSEHYQVGHYIMHARLDDAMQNLTIDDPAERWKGGPVS